MYRLEKEQYGKKQVEEIVETNEGSLSRLLSINDRPLTAKQQVEEDERVRLLMNSRNAQQKLRRALDAETLQGRRLFKMLPDAFVFSYADGEGNLVKLSFRPNPSFHPPSPEARVFHDMEGEMWVDCRQERLTAFDGHLTQTVKFGFGLLGHLDKGRATLRFGRQKLSQAIGTDYPESGYDREGSLVCDRRCRKPSGLPTGIR